MTRLRTYGVRLSAVSAMYSEAVLSDAAFRGMGSGGRGRAVDDAGNRRSLGLDPKGPHPALGRRPGLGAWPFSEDVAFLGPAGPRSDEPLVAPVRRPHARLSHACVRPVSQTIPSGRPRVAGRAPASAPARDSGIAHDGSRPVWSAFAPSSHRRRFRTGHVKPSTPGPFNQVVRSSERFATTKRSAIETIPSP